MKKKHVIYEGYAAEETVISEMTDVQAADSLVHVDEMLIERMVEDDEKPMFVTLPVARAGKSGNGRTYTVEGLMNLLEQINRKRPVGYMGHIPSDQRSSKFPDPQVMWLGATVKEVEGVPTLFAKGYVLPEAKKLRTYLKKAKAAGSNVAVSIYGVIREARRGLSKAMLDTSKMILESIDFARPGSEGFTSNGMFYVTQEMVHDGGDDISEKGDDMTREEVISSATASELKELNPTVVQEMLDEAATSIEAESEAVVQEMTEITTVLGETGEKTPVQVIQEMQEELSEKNHELRELQLSSQIHDKVEGNAARKVIRNLVIAEMRDDEEVTTTVDRVLASEAGREVIAEMIDRAPTVKPMVERPSAVARKYTTKKK